MKIFNLIAGTFLLLASCNNQNQINPQMLNGYWEIEKIETEDGNTKEYPYNEYVDFFSTENNKGFRSKVKPLIGGKYQSNKKQIKYSIIQKNDSTFIQYDALKGKWKDYILNLTSSKLIVVNKQGTTYFYKPYKPIIIDEK